MQTFLSCQIEIQRVFLLLNLSFSLKSDSFSDVNSKGSQKGSLQSFMILELKSLPSSNIPSYFLGRPLLHGKKSHLISVKRTYYVKTPEKNKDLRGPLTMLQRWSKNTHTVWLQTTNTCQVPVNTVNTTTM